MPKENSLFGQINSLFRRKFSLFDCVGNSIKKGNQYGRLGRCFRADNARIRENSLYFPYISGKSSAENGSLVTASSAILLRADALRRMSSEASAKEGCLRGA